MGRTVRVILRSDVPGLGSAGTEHSVAAPYAQRVLLPRHLAVSASLRERQRLSAERSRHVEATQRASAAALSTLTKVKGRTILIPMRASGAKLYGSVGVQEIVRAAKTALGADLDPDWLRLASPITTVGDHAVQVQVPSAEPVSVTVTVSAA